MLEPIRLVEDSDLPVTATLKELGILRQHVLRLVPPVQEQGCGGTGRPASGAGVHWNRIPDTVRQRVVDPADEVRTGVS